MDRPPGKAAPAIGTSSEASFQHLLRELTAPVLGFVARHSRDFAAAEDAVQEAMIAAAARWSQDGVPDNPRAWLTQVALRRVTDQLRSEAARRRRECESAWDTQGTAPAADSQTDVDEDETLILFFMCCHPSLTRSSAIALALRALGGLTTAEIARAFLVPEATLAQRISRAKATIRSSGVPFQLPCAEDRAQRLRAVLHVLYLMFSEGYASGAGPSLQRPELSREAIRLARSLCALLPGESEVEGLLSLMLLTDARRGARFGPDEELIPLDKQDRSLWGREEIAEGAALLERALAKGAVGPYQLQAAIAALHDEALRVEDTDWPQILALYELLTRISDNPMVRLNHAIAAAMVHGPSKGLALLARLDDEPLLAQHYRLDVVRAHLLEMTGDRAAAVGLFRIAAEKTSSEPERHYLIAQAVRLSGPSSERRSLPAQS
ncbi:MAG: RNA polymerase sigma factor [Steroidobacteraceae bacterium]